MTREFLRTSNYGAEISAAGLKAVRLETEAKAAARAARKAEKIAA